MNIVVYSLSFYLQTSLSILGAFFRESFPHYKKIIIIITSWLLYIYPGYKSQILIKYWKSANLINTKDSILLRTYQDRVQSSWRKKTYQANIMKCFVTAFRLHVTQLFKRFNENSTFINNSIKWTRLKFTHISYIHSNIC